MNILAKTKDLSHEEWLKYRTQGIGGSDVLFLQESIRLNRFTSYGLRRLVRWSRKKEIPNTPILELFWNQS